MFRSKAVLLLVAVIIAGLVVLGIGVGALTAVALNTNASQALVQGVVRDFSANLPAAAPLRTGAAAAQPAATQAPATQAATVQVAAATAAPAPVINIQPNADAESQLLEAIYQKVNPSVVRVFNLAANSNAPTADALPQGEGSGWVYDTQGRIVTNDHVIRGADKIQVTFSDGTTVDAKLVGTDPNGDIAVVQVDPQEVTLVPVELGDSAQVKVGEQAIAIGNPFGFAGTMTRGIVSAVGRTIPAVTGFEIPEAIQTDAAINPGNSGGPLLNSHGQVVGINDQISSASGSNSGVGFAIPINIVKRIVPQLIKNGKYVHSYIGMSGTTYTKAWASALDLPANAKGAYVEGVVNNSPAARAGLQAGSQDTTVVLGVAQNGPVYLQKGGDLVTALDGHPITKMDDLLIYLEENTSPGQTIKLTVLRSGGQQATLSLTLGERPSRVPTGG
jgi:S1-C subfamily serine protease